LTTLLASYGIDSLIVGRRYLPQMVSAVLPATKILSEISYYSNIAGLVLLVPAVITGFHEWWEIAKYKGENKFVDGVVSCGDPCGKYVLTCMLRLQKVQSYPDRAFNVATIHGLLNVAVGKWFPKPPCRLLNLFSWFQAPTRCGHGDNDAWCPTTCPAPRLAYFPGLCSFLLSAVLHLGKFFV
jgi:hypothetical protein